MRLSDINEAKTKTKTKTKTDFDDINDMFPPEAPDDGDLTTVEPKQQKKSAALRKGSAAATRDRIRNMEPIQNAPEIGDMEFSDEEYQSDFDKAINAIDAHDAPGYVNPVPEQPETLPAIPSRDLATRGTELTTGTDPEWMSLADLPGYMQQGIRMMGRRVFKSFTSAGLEEMHIISTLTHSDMEVRNVAGWIKENGSELDGFEMAFQNIQGYNMKGSVWTAGDNDYFLMEDFAGRYIYSWPAKTRIGN